MEQLFNFSNPFKAVFTVTLYSSLVCTALTILIIIVRVMPQSRKNRPYYVTILVQALTDFLQDGSSLYCTMAVSFKVKYTGIWMFQVSVMLTAYLAIYWMHVLLRSRAVTRFLMTIVTVLSIPMIFSTSYLILTKNIQAEISSGEWFFMSGSRNFAQLSFGAIVFTTCLKVYRITGHLSSPATRRLHRKVWIGLVFKTICSVSVALFGVNTFVSILSYGSLPNYMVTHTWWDTVFFTITCAYAGINTCITFWMLSGMIFKKVGKSSDCSRVTVSFRNTGQKSPNLR